jgi:hypothetical protein
MLLSQAAHVHWSASPSVFQYRSFCVVVPLVIA